VPLSLDELEALRIDDGQHRNLHCEKQTS